MTIETPANKIATIQMLRGIAAMMVVVHHLQNQLGRLGLARIDSDALASGVDIFFVISGFIMWITTTADRPHTATSFYTNRVTRVVPLYWALTTLVVMIALVYPQALSTTRFDSWHVLFSYLFVASEHPMTGSFEPILIPGWTLNLEMFFYLIFGVIISISGNRPREKALLSIAVLGTLSMAGYWLAPRGIASFYTSGLLLEFSAGIGLGVLYTRRIIKPSNGWLVLAAAGVCCLASQLYFTLDIAREFKWGVPALMIVSGMALSHDIRAIALEWLGDISYSLYLSHPIALAASYKVWSMGALPAQAFPVFAISVCLIAAAGTFYLLEIPSTKLAKRMLNSGGRQERRSLRAEPLRGAPVHQHAP